MDKPDTDYSTVDEYINSFSGGVRDRLGEMRAAIRKAAPDAQECISYRMPAYKQNGPLAYFAAFKNHIGFYPTASGIEAFKDEFKPYKSGKGSVQFPFGQPLPLELVAKVVRFKLEENMKNAKK
jgi:uncharacterized protein YdhG (YjbR/CyaY superfamily)